MDSLDCGANASQLSRSPRSTIKELALSITTWSLQGLFADAKSLSKRLNREYGRY